MLEEYPTAYVAFGCGDSKKTLLIPYALFGPLVKNMWTTEKENRMYWHVIINYKNDKFLLSQPKTTDHNPVDITEYLI